MSTVKADLGKHLLVAMGNTPASLTMIRTIAAELSDLSDNRITLMHYMTPIFWEHGGDHSPEGLAEIRREEEQWEAREHEAEQAADSYFELARSILEKAGVPPDHIETKLCWEGDDVCDAIQNELADGHYSSVVVGQHHHGILSRLLHNTVADIISRRAGDIPIWVVDDAPELA